MWLYPETQAIWKSLKLVLSLFNDTFRQNPNKPFGMWLWIAVYSDVLVLIRGDQVSVLIWISCMNPCTLTVKPSQFVTNSQINLEKAALLPFHFFSFIKRWRVQSCRSSRLEIGLCCIFLWFQHIEFREPSEPVPWCLRKSTFSFVFFL